VANLPGGAITGGQYGITMSGFVSATATNSGTIAGTGHYGAVLSAAAGNAFGANETTGTIVRGYDGVVINAQGTITNAGGIIGGKLSGVYLTQGTLVKQTGGTIIGYFHGIFMHHGSVTNAGEIVGSSVVPGQRRCGAVCRRLGLQCQRAVIRGRTGIHVFSAGGTVENAGTVTGDTGTAVSLDNGFAHLVIDRPRRGVQRDRRWRQLDRRDGQQLELASGALIGTLTGLGGAGARLTTGVIPLGGTFNVGDSTLGHLAIITGAL
jgi:hypothetical protein